ncbi:MAG: glyoxylate/hydroxypyruvate reductase A [Balneolaceae bacterium]|nr:glyoxylate/hydroxypyruvate reductase A [Balneolaceae bacterium]MCH8549157.1 glyoxylate/hydroxypyruvate reductase A [Balneolaceae bacterium]
MSLLLVAKNRDMSSLGEAIRATDPNIDVDIWPGVRNRERIQFAVSWRHPDGIFESYPNLKAISSLGAGVDHLFADQTIPEKIRFSRVVIPSLAEQMADYVLTAVLNMFRDTGTYIDQQRAGQWKKHPPLRKDEVTIGVMGLGELGRESASRLAMNGFMVNGWSRSKKELNGIRTFSGDEIDQFLQSSNILVCLLPLTEETEGILDLELFKKLRRPAYLVNVARGKHLTEEDLIYALDTDLITHAVLDVFEQEPLPDSHPFWGRKKITITPHTASITDPREAAELIVENYKRVLSGIDLLYEVDRNRGY